jgi:hypothetical protein
MGHNPLRGPSAVKWELSIEKAAGTNGLTYLPKHGGPRDNNNKGYNFKNWIWKCFSVTISERGGESDAKLGSLVVGPFGANRNWTVIILIRAFLTTINHSDRAPTGCINRV